ncbi:MAG: TonB-dependent receptor plug domain-containing protein [Microbacter sp.]
MFLFSLVVRLFYRVSAFMEKPILLSVLLFAATGLHAQKDSVHIMHELTVTAVALPQHHNTLTPIQTFNASTLAAMNAVQISDVVKHFAGVIVKDYGGIGGLKTISIRGLGPTHTAVNYDGWLMSDAQNGEIDLSKVSLDHVKTISLSNGDNDDVLESARAFASAGLLTVVTQRPVFDSSSVYRAQFFLQNGSFGWIHPSLWMANRWSSHFSSTLMFETQYTNGHYPFTLQNGDSTQHLMRTNSDVHFYHAEMNLFYLPDAYHQWITKLYTVISARGLPGAVIFYNPTAAQGQRLYDQDYFVQSRFSSTGLSKTQYAVGLKAVNSDTRYVDPYFLNASGGIDNRFRQQEYDLSGVLAQKWDSLFQFSAATDLVYNHLNANLSGFSQPSRLSVYGSVKERLHVASFQSEIALLSTYINDWVTVGTQSPHHFRLSPFISMSVHPFKQLSWEWRAFYKESFRMPTFNELYYTGIGNVPLKPEVAQQWNVGTSYRFLSHNAFFSVSVDGYYNRVLNKIVAVPSANLFIWSMLNLGLVSIHGVDVAFQSAWQLNRKLRLIFDGSESFQSALDLTNPQWSSYRQQIAYTPKQSGAITVGCLMPWVNVAYNMLFSGDRFDLSHSVLPGYSDGGFSLWHDFPLSNVTIQAKGEVMNVWNEQYVVVKNYPMPGRSWRVTLGVTF